MLAFTYRLSLEKFLDFDNSTGIRRVGTLFERKSSSINTLRKFIQNDSTQLDLWCCVLLLMPCAMPCTLVSLTPYSTNKQQQAEANVWSPPKSLLNYGNFMRLLSVYRLSIYVHFIPLSPDYRIENIEFPIRTIRHTHALITSLSLALSFSKKTIFLSKNCV